jgi:UDP-glucose 4-epimerase
MPHTSSTPVSIVSGGAGFIAANLVGQLLDAGHAVLAIDNLSRGRQEYLQPFAAHPAFRFVQADLSERAQCKRAFDAADALGRPHEVWHLAANSDIPAGVADPDVDLKDTFLTTFEIARAMRDRGIGTLHFASSSAVYGDHGEAELHEGIGPLLPISNYGAMKLASEAQASAAAESFLERVHLFRFPNVVGVPATHGVLLDFVRKLKHTPGTLDVLGDGSQQKAYLHVSDLVGAMLHVRGLPPQAKVLPINIGPVDSGVQVRWIAQQVVARVAPSATIRYGTGNKGWIGDVPRFRYSTQALADLGWEPTLDSAGAIKRAIDQIADQEGIPEGGLA